jgi:F-type H+-transporting ATPase subunit b
MIEINASLFYQMANFLVLMFLLNLVLYRPLRRIVRERKEKMDGLSAAAQADQEALTRAETSLAQGRREAQQAGMARKNDLRGQALDREKDLLAKVHADMEAESARLSREIADQIALARQALQAQVESFSLAAAHKILGRSF